MHDPGCVKSKQYGEVTVPGNGNESLPINIEDIFCTNNCNSNKTKRLQNKIHHKPKGTTIEIIITMISKNM